MAGRARVAPQQASVGADPAWFAVLGLVEGVSGAGGLVLLVDGLVGLSVPGHAGETWTQTHNSSLNAEQKTDICYGRRTAHMGSTALDKYERQADIDNNSC